MRSLAFATRPASLSAAASASGATTHAPSSPSPSGGGPGWGCSERPSALVGRPPVLTVALAITLVLVGCSRPVVSARTSPMQPVSPAEADAAARHHLSKRCSGNWGLLFPGLGQACLGKDLEAAILGTLGAGELATAIAVGQTADDGAVHPGSALPLLAFSDLWIYAFVDTRLDAQLAARRLYVPQDSLADLVAAPFNIKVLKRPDVWAGTLVLLAAGVGLSALLDRDALDTDRLGDDPNIFGRTMDPAYGYPLAFAAGTALFSHVAIAEEALFRGWIQSSIARDSGENAGHVIASLLFGLAHAPNAFGLEDQEQFEYLIYGVPFLTAAGAYLGWVYRRADYSLTAPVAAHFWYDLLLSATFFALDPQRSPISASLSIPF